MHLSWRIPSWTKAQGRDLCWSLGSWNRYIWGTGTLFPCTKPRSSWSMIWIGCWYSARRRSFPIGPVGRELLFVKSVRHIWLMRLASYFSHLTMNTILSTPRTPTLLQTHRSRFWTPMLEAFFNKRLPLYLIRVSVSTSYPSVNCSLTATLP